MPVVRVVIIPGHGLIGPSTPDPGGQGAGGSEYAWTSTAAELIAGACRSAGLEVAVDEVGASLHRSADADSIAPDLVLYVHGDVGAGGVFFFPDSARGITYANLLGRELYPILPSIAVKTATSSAYPRAYGLLARTTAPAVLLELCDQRSAASVTHLHERLPDVAAAVARGLGSEAAWTG